MTTGSTLVRVVLAVAAAAVSCGALRGEPPAAPERTASATSTAVATPTATPIADNDAYWLTIMANVRGGLRPVQLSSDSILVPACEAPPGAGIEQVVHQPGEKLGEGRSIIFYSEYDSHRYVMILDWQASLDGCAEPFVTVVGRAKQQQREMHEIWGDYICNSMRPAASGLPMPDLVLRQRQPSIAVAAAYVAEFCN